MIKALPLLLGVVLLSSCTFEQTREGSPDPGQVRYPANLVNGDFVVVGSRGFPHVGDTFKENTRWTYDLSNSPFVRHPDKEFTITSATLAFDFLVNGSAHADAIHFSEGSELGAWFAFCDLRFGGGKTKFYDNYRIELLNRYSSDDLLKEVRRTGGVIPMRYSDDALISRATLRIEFRP